MSVKRLRWVLRAIPPKSNESGPYQILLSVLDSEDIPEDLPSWETRSEAEQYLRSGAESNQVLKVFVEPNLKQKTKSWTDRIFCYFLGKILTRFHRLGRSLRKDL